MVKEDKYIKDPSCLSCDRNETFCQYCKRNYNDYYKEKENNKDGNTK